MQSRIGASLLASLVSLLMAFFSLSMNFEKSFSGSALSMFLLFYFVFAFIAIIASSKLLDELKALVKIKKFFQNKNSSIVFILSFVIIILINQFIVKDSEMIDLVLAYLIIINSFLLSLSFFYFVN